MKRFLLDTHIVVWFHMGDKSLDLEIKEGIDYYQGKYYVSVESLKEIVILQKLKKIKMTTPVKDLIKSLVALNIEILPVIEKHVLAFEALSDPVINGKKHEDPFDRMIIAQSIAEKLILVSADTKFPDYKDKGFLLLVN